MKHNYQGSYENVLLLPLGHSDIESLRIWRNNSDETKFLRPIPFITKEMQENWFNKYLTDKNVICFGIHEVAVLHRLVGSLSLYDFSDNQAEIGKIQVGDSQAHGRSIATNSFAIALWIGFSKLSLKNIIAFVHYDNVKACKSYFKLGFKVVGNRKSCVGGFEYKISINKDDLVNKFPGTQEIVI